jgi:hypothetical protein
MYGVNRRSRHGIGRLSTEIADKKLKFDGVVLLRNSEILHERIHHVQHPGSSQGFAYIRQTSFPEKLCGRSLECVYYPRNQSHF